MSPEITLKAIYVVGFISACLFYFAMYVLYTRRKKRTWFELGVFIFNIAKWIGIAVVAATVAVMILYRISFNAALDIVATFVSNAGYYMPFLP